MAAPLRDKSQFARFFVVSLGGTAADYLLALLLEGMFDFPYLAASVAGFLLGTLVNFFGHTIFSFAHTTRLDLSLVGYARYLLAVGASLAVRLGMVALLANLTTWPFWFILLGAIGASFIASYVISALWVFRKPG